jgi:Tfp pilus assembly PilM family ATPase
VRLGVASQKMAVRVMELPAIDDEQQLDAAIRFQAQEELPMPVEQAVLDHRLLERIDDEQGGRMRILVVAARRDSVEHLLAAARRAGLSPELVDLSAFAMIRALHVPEARHFLAPRNGEIGPDPVERPATDEAAGADYAEHAVDGDYAAEPEHAADPEYDAEPEYLAEPQDHAAVEHADDAEHADALEPAQEEGDGVATVGHEGDDTAYDVVEDGADAAPQYDLEGHPTGAYDLDAVTIGSGEDALDGVDESDYPPLGAPVEYDFGDPAAERAQDVAHGETAGHVEQAGYDDRAGYAEHDDGAIGPDGPSSEPAWDDATASTESLGTVYCYVGGLTNLAIAVGRTCFFNRVLQNGLESMAATLAERRGLTIDHAREWLRHVGLERDVDRIEGEREIIEEAREVLVSGSRRIADEVRLSIEYYHSTVPNAPRVESAVLAGPGIAIAGLGTLLEQELGLPVEALDEVPA